MTHVLRTCILRTYICVYVCKYTQYFRITYIMYVRTTTSSHHSISPSMDLASLAGHTYLPCAHTGVCTRRKREGENTYSVNGQVFVRLRRNVGGTNQIAVKVISNSIRT